MNSILLILYIMIYVSSLFFDYVNVNAALIHINFVFELFILHPEIWA